MKITKVEFVLLILSLFLLAAIILTIVLTQSNQSISSPDVSLDIIFFDKGRNRFDVQLTLWKQFWHSRLETRFVYFKNSSEQKVTIQENIITINTSQTETELFSQLSHIVPNTAGRSFLWASDHIIPVTKISASTFQVPHTGIHRFFSPCGPDGQIMELKDEFETNSCIPVSLFSYQSTKDLSVTDLQLRFLQTRDFAYAYIYQNIVLVTDSDADQLDTVLHPEFFQIVHISSRASNPTHLNSLVIEHWNKRVT